MLNQVRRLANRIKEASDGVTKNIRQLDINVQATQMEIKEYFQRYQSELKKREEHFNREVELFKENEHVRQHFNAAVIQFHLEADEVGKGCA